MKKIIKILCFLILLIFRSSIFSQDTISSTTLNTQGLLNVNHIYTASSSNQGLVSNNRNLSECGNYCANQNFEIKTGFDRYTQLPIVSGYADNNWTVISDPIANGSSCVNTIEPRAAFTISQSSSWEDNIVSGYNIGWISGYPSNSATCGGDYIYESTFCLSENYEGAELVLSILSDNQATVYLNGNLLGQQINNYGFLYKNLLFISSLNYFQTGVNTLRVKVYNEGSITGLSCYAKVSVTEGCIQCCDEGGSITGFKFMDTDENQLLNASLDTPLANVQFNLIQNNITVETTVSDALGMYVFNDVPPGVYSVEEVAPIGTCPIIPLGGTVENISVTSFSSISGVNFLNGLCDLPPPCETCIGSFAPIPSGDYLVGTWVKEENASPNKTSYTYPELSVICQTPGGPATFGPYQAQGEIIDGWQRIEEKIHIPLDATNIQIVLASTSGNVFYDDVRMFPFEASMKTYVYDPVNMRLAAELDERHYATFYEYDEEGKLVRIKKETEKGVMTIQETKSNSAK